MQLCVMQSYPRSTRNVSLQTLGFRLGLNLGGGGGGVDENECKMQVN